MRLRCSFLILMALVLCACASNSPAPSPVTPQLSATDPALLGAVKADRDAATQTYVSCLDRAAKRLDDHRSDPMTIAHGMMSACGAEFDQEVKVYSRHLDLQGEQRVRLSRRDRNFAAVPIVFCQTLSLVGTWPQRTHQRPIQTVLPKRFRSLYCVRYRCPKGRGQT
jgi:hypothetical protein